MISKFDRRWLVQPAQMHVEDVQVETQMGLERIADESDKTLQRVLLDHVLAVLETVIRNHL